MRKQIEHYIALGKSVPSYPNLAASSDPCRSRVIGVALYLHKAGIQVRRPGSHTHRHTCFQRLIDADRRDDDRAAKLEWLNFSWSVGATAGPVCFLPFLRRGDTGSQFAMMLALSLAMFAWVVPREHQEPRITPRGGPAQLVPPQEHSFHCSP
jgi:hypothetical protein